jgi:hypothetical protein
MVRRLGTAAVLLFLLAAGTAAAQTHSYIGSMHEHSAYSDGWPGSRPLDYYLSGRGHGLDFMGGSDHSDNLELPNSFSDYCVNPQNPQFNTTQPGCLLADSVNPADSFRKWDATLEQVVAATTPKFTPFRGFEWTSDRYGHINVYFSKNWENAKTDGGYVTMDTFYSWLTASDGIATFNHPGDKKLSTSDPAFNWNDFAYVPAADPQMVGIEVYNSASDFAAPGAHSGPPEGWYAHALDKGWHVGAIGAEDLGHHYGDDWGGPGQAKTVILAASRSAADLEAALKARHFYAVARPTYRLDYTVDGNAMGSRLTRTPGAAVHFAARATDATGKVLASARIELVTSHGAVVATGTGGRLDARRHWTHSEGWYFVRAITGGAVIAYSSPVWVSG